MEIYPYNGKSDCEGNNRFFCENIIKQIGEKQYLYEKMRRLFRLVKGKNDKKSWCRSGTQ